MADESTGFNRAEKEILVVEDSPTQALKLRMLLEENGYPHRLAQNGKLGLAEVKAKKPDLIVSDIQMPEMDGYQLCQAVKNDPELCHIPVILFTTLSDPEDILRGVRAGADSYVTKPYEWRFLQSKIDFHLASSGARTAEPTRLQFIYKQKPWVMSVTPERLLTLVLSVYEESVIKNRELMETQTALTKLNETLEDKVDERTEELSREVEDRKKKELILIESGKRLQKAMRGIIAAMATVMGMRDPLTAAHQRRVAKLCQAIAVEMALPKKQADGLRLAAVIHDLGKMAVPMDVLATPRRLTEEDLLRVRAHAQAGYEVLAPIEFPWPLADIVVQHHERLDGSGYPRGLSGGQILPEARILAVADVAEAMISPRPYRTPHSIDAMLAELARNRGTLFDPDCVDVCTRLFTTGGFSFES
ncbi:MAG: HD domain-containing phosphohydrolase [Thermodesulfobacteriota bacterium]